jgi:hypothetical protein
VSMMVMLASADRGLVHVAPADLPLVVLLGEHRADQADDRLAVGEDPDDVGAPADLLVQPLLGLLDQTCRQCPWGRRCRRGCRGRRRRAAPRRRGSARRAGRRPGQLAQASSAALLGEDGAHQRADQRLGVAGHLGEQVAHEVGAAALPRAPSSTAAMASFSPPWASEVTSFHAGQPAGDQAAQERRPRRAVLGVPSCRCRGSRGALGVDAGGDQHEVFTMRPPSRTFMHQRVDPHERYGPASSGRERHARRRSSSSAQIRETWTWRSPPCPSPGTSSTRRVDTPST